MSGSRRALALGLSLLVTTGLAVLARPASVAAATAGPGVWTETAYTTVFGDSRPSADSGSRIVLDTARNEYEGAQIVLRRNQSFTISRVAFTALTSGANAIAATNLRYHFVETVHLSGNSVLDPSQPVYPVTRAAPGPFPDPLSNAPSKTVPARTTQSIWVVLFVPAGTPGDVYHGTATVETSQGNFAVPIEADVRPVTLPETRDSAFTSVQWSHLFGDIDSGEDFIQRYYPFTLYSEPYWQFLRNVAQVMKAHRTNNLTLPMVPMLIHGGSYLDSAGNYQFNWSRFDQVVQLFLDTGGIKRLEGFWTNGGPGYWSKWDVQIINSARQKAWVPWDSFEANRWIDQYIPALRAHLQAKGWSHLWWMHIGDEPQGAHGEQAWTAIAQRVKSHWPDVKLGDAAFHEPAASRLAQRADILIPNGLNYNIDPTVYDAERLKGKELWIYNCNIPVANYLNRFIDQPQWHQRLTMWYAYSRHITGYLHYAFNKWHEPFDTLPSKGDNVLVWPDRDRSTIQSSVRYESLRDGIEDYELLSLIGSQDLAKALVSDGDTYTPDTAYMARIREIALDIAAGRPLPDRARTATATASAGTPQNAIDGNPATAWQPGGSGWIRLDLGRQTQIDGVRLMWSGSAPSATLQLSYDGAKWTSVTTSSGFTGVNGKARYVRLNTSGGALAGFEVLGAALPAANLAGGRGYQLSEAPSVSWPDSGGTESTDGVLADAWDDGRTYGYTLAAGQTKTVEATIDLGSVRQVDNVKVHAYEEYPAYRPDSVKVLTSVDGARFAQRTVQTGTNGASGVWFDLRFAPAPARYLKVIFTKAHTAQADKLFIDEIEVYEAIAAKANLAWGRTYTKSVAPDASYADSGEESTDGTVGGTYSDGLSYGYSVPSGQTRSVDVTIDLGVSRQVSRVLVAKFDNGVHDYAPDSVQVRSGTTVLAEALVPDGRWFDLTFAPTGGRHVTLRFTKTGATMADWLFIDEIAVFGDLPANAVRGYALSAAPDPSYPDSGLESADGLLGGAYGDGRSYGFHLNPGETRTVELTVDLGSARAFSAVSARQYLASGHSYRPDSVAVLTSTDGVTYTQRGQSTGAVSRWFDVTFATVTARYVKVRFTKTEASLADWLFLDEVTVHAA